MTTQSNALHNHTERLHGAQADVCDAAAKAIIERMDLGVQQGYDPASWKSESVARHVHRACKHALTHLEITSGERDDDSENHLDAAICRLSMALAIASSESPP